MLTYTAIVLKYRCSHSALLRAIRETGVTGRQANRFEPRLWTPAEAATLNDYIRKNGGGK